MQNRFAVLLSICILEGHNSFYQKISLLTNNLLHTVVKKNYSIVMNSSIIHARFRSSLFVFSTKHLL